MKYFFAACLLGIIACVVRSVKPSDYDDEWLGT